MWELYSYAEVCNVAARNGIRSKKKKKGVTLCKHKLNKYQCRANKPFEFEFTDEMFLRPRSNDLFNGS